MGETDVGGACFVRVSRTRKGSGGTGPGIVSILIIGAAKEGKMWAEGPSFDNLGRPPFSISELVPKK